VYDRDAQTFGMKCQDCSGPIVQTRRKGNVARHYRGPPATPHHSRAVAKVEIQLAFKALAFFAAFMAARSLTAYLTDKDQGGERDR
jgi:hypothetical protein